jgi:Mg/Co/Ni transporter MgtE
MDQEEVAFQFQKYSLASAPVKDTAGRLVGMITVDDMVDVIQEEAEEDLFSLLNVSSADGADSVVDTVRARAPWLAVNLITAFIASGIISLFEGTLNQVVQLAILMPVVAALGGNAGSQGLVVAVRAIAERQLEGDAVRRAILREALSGVVNGLLFAVGVGLVALVWFHNVELSIVLGDRHAGDIPVGGLLRHPRAARTQEAGRRPGGSLLGLRIDADRCDGIFLLPGTGDAGSALTSGKGDGLPPQGKRRAICTGAA